MDTAGQEITQFTYFQQAGGQALEIPSVEITYGLERIITVLQVSLFATSSRPHARVNHPPSWL